MDKETQVCHYFVDEAGDGTLFSAKGQIIIGTEGCSRYFILGVLEVSNPEYLNRDIESFRKKLLDDPYFKKVPSMQPEAKKTAVVFHATNDIPEVRREIFNLLLHHDLKFLAAVKDKRKVLEYVRHRNQIDAAYRYHPNELYDYMVRRLFKNLIHKADEYNITFSERGKSDQTAALRKALEAAQARFVAQWGVNSQSLVNVIPRKSIGTPCLQAADYFLWALQRFYERREDRYIEYMWPEIRLVHDIDDTRQNQYGAYYTKNKPLTLAALEKNLPGI